MNKKILISIIVVLIVGGGILVWWHWGEPIKAKICYLKLNKINGYGAYMPDPASYFCKCMGGSLDTEKTPAGGERGLCKMGSEIYTEWDYFRKMNPDDKTYSRPTSTSIQPLAKCGDGICGPIEKRNPNLCPQDCQQGVGEHGAEKINILLIIHTGEGGSGNCEMTGVTSLENSRYKDCRDKLKEISNELYKLGIPAVFEFLGPFADLLSKDKDFSFDNDILAKGHSIGFHAHAHCYFNGTVGSSECKNVDLAKGIYWGSIGDNSQPTISELLARIDSGRLFIPKKEIGGVHGISYQYKTNPNELMKELNNKGIKIITGTKEMAGQDPYSSGSACSKTNVILNPHPTILNQNYPNIVYFDHGPAYGNGDIIGFPLFKESLLEERFKKLVECRNFENSEDNPYIFAMGTHFWNIKTNQDADPKTYDGISDLMVFKKWVEDNYKDVAVFSNIEDVYSEFIKGE